jgi:hypothetical protein
MKHENVTFAVIDVNSEVEGFSCLNIDWKALINVLICHQASSRGQGNRGQTCESRVWNYGTVPGH